MTDGPRVTPDPPPRLGRRALAVIIATTGLVAVAGTVLLVVSILILRS
ncbi:MAG: hypothetical protein ACR2P0_19415 [Acidimicrobiales bacterium]